MEVEANGAGVIQKFQLGLQKPFKGPALPGEVDFPFASTGLSDYPPGFKLPAATKGHQYIVLFVKAKHGRKSVLYEQRSLSDVPDCIFRSTSRQVRGFGQALVKYLLSSQQSNMDRSLALTNLYAGLAIAKDSHDPEIRAMLQKIVNTGGRREQAYARRDLIPRITDTDGVRNGKLLSRAAKNCRYWLGTSFKPDGMREMLAV